MSQLSHHLEVSTASTSEPTEVNGMDDQHEHQTLRPPIFGNFALDFFHSIFVVTLSIHALVIMYGLGTRRPELMGVTLFCLQNRR